MVYQSGSGDRGTVFRLNEVMVYLRTDGSVTKLFTTQTEDTPVGEKEDVTNFHCFTGTDSYLEY